MKKFSLKFKVTASLLTFAFIFQTMQDINDHTYSTGICNIEVYSGFNCFPNGLEKHNCRYHINF